jgi:hypothetical protein
VKTRTRRRARPGVVGMTRISPVLALAGALSLTVAVFQAIVSFSPEMSLYYGAPPELAAHPPLLAAAGIGAAVLFLIFGLYGLSGARFLRPLPLLRPALVGIAVIYLIRGLAVIPAVLAPSRGVKRFRRIVDRSRTDSAVSHSFPAPTPRAPPRVHTSHSS